VFKAFWTQPTPESNNPFGEVIRFVVVRPHKRHSICLYVNQLSCSTMQILTLCRAIHTYQNQGTTARHARARDHVIIYTGDDPPDPLPGEDNVILSRPAIKVRLDPKGEELLPASRLNLAKPYTMEHNTPISPVGKISSRDVENVRRYYAEVQGVLISTPSLPDVNESEEEEEDGDDDDEEDEG
jgi:uncharacterized protein DUF6590